MKIRNIFLILQNRIHVLLPYAVMGGTALVAGSLCITLPETKDMPTSETMDFQDGAENGNEQRDPLDRLERKWSLGSYVNPSATIKDGGLKMDSLTEGVTDSNAVVLPLVEYNQVCDLAKLN